MHVSEPRICVGFRFDVVHFPLAFLKKPIVFPHTHNGIIFLFPSHLPDVFTSVNILAVLFMYSSSSALDLDSEYVPRKPRNIVAVVIIKLAKR